jgi:hypothetical protein
MKRILLVAAILLSQTASAQGTTWGFTIRNFMNADRGTQNGYIMGVQEMRRMCIPPGVTLDQAREMALKYARENPNTWHLSAETALFISQVRAHWACKQM